jgi:hypothetical protein
MGHQNQINLIQILHLDWRAVTVVQKGIDQDDFSLAIGNAVRGIPKKLELCLCVHGVSP